MARTYSGYILFVIFMFSSYIGSTLAGETTDTPSKTSTFQQTMGDLNDQTKCSFANQAIDEKHDADVNHAASYIAFSAIMSYGPDLTSKLTEETSQELFQLSFDNCRVHPDATIQSQVIAAILSLRDKINAAK